MDTNHPTAARTHGLWRSRLARRLIAVFVAVAAAPLIVALVLVGRAGKETILATGTAMETTNAATVRRAGEDFQRLGRAALGRSSARVAAVSVAASRAASRQWQHDQAEALMTTASAFSGITRAGIDGAMHQSLATNQDILARVNRETDALLARAAGQTAQRSAARVERAMREQINARMQEQARQLAGQVTAHVQDHLDYLALTAQMLDPRAGGFARQKPILDALVRRYPLLTEVAVTDAAGREIAASAPDRVLTPSDLADRSRADYVRAALADTTYVGVETPPQAGAAPVLRLAVPVELYRGKVTGVLAARLSLDDLWDEIRAVRIGASGFAAVTDARGRALLPRTAPGPLLHASADVPLLRWRIVVAQPRAEVMAPVEALRADIRRGTDDALAQMHGRIQASSRVASADLRANSQRLQEAATGTAQARTRDAFGRLARRTARQTDAEMRAMERAIRRQGERAQGDNNRRMAGAAATTSARLAARMAPLTARSLRQASERLQVLTITIVGAASLLSAAAALLLAARLVGPLVRLAQGTRDLGAGDLDRRVDERAPDEIGDLAVAFNRMAESLQRSRAELHQTEAQLVQSAKLASLGTLSAGVAHELNQPVAIVRGLAQQLQEEPGLAPEVVEDLALIEGQTGRMMKIIKHLRTFCRAGGYEMTDVDVNQVVRDCFILIEAQLRAHNVGVSLELCPGSPVVRGDANELEQVFLNLITNARDAMEGRADARITIRSRSDGGRCVLEFADNGAGVPEDALPRIFDPFFTTKEAGKGTGLGLSISHGIVEKHQGTLTAHNAGGAVFTLTLPCTEETAAQPLPRAA